MAYALVPRGDLNIAYLRAVRVLARAAHPFLPIARSVSMRELAQQFVFEANASDVYSFIMGPEEERPRVIKTSDGIWAIQCVFLIEDWYNSLYGIVLGVHIMLGQRFDWLREDALWLVWDREAAHITIDQDKPGECVAKLYIETDPQRWYQREDGPWVVPKNVGSSLVTQIWREHIVQAWISRATSKNEAAREAGPTTRTRERFEVFRRLKAEHPTWSQDRVAREACEELGEVVFAETVRNTYRLMGEKWPRGDRVR